MPTLVGLVAELGGLYEFFHLLIGIFIAPFVKSWSLEKKLIKKLFKRPGTSWWGELTLPGNANDDDDDPRFRRAMAAVSKREKIRAHKYPDWITAIVRACEDFGKERDPLYEAAQKQLRNELDITWIIKQNRFMHNALRYLLNPTEFTLVGL